jgi:hypothetical protein
MIFREIGSISFEGTLTHMLDECMRVSEGILVKQLTERR